MSYRIILVMAVIVSDLVVSGAPPIVVNQYNLRNRDQYSWGYKLSDAQEVNQEIYKKVLDGGEQVLAFKGSYSFSDADGIKHTVEYTADENGYNPKIDAPRLITTTSGPVIKEDSSTTTARPITTRRYFSTPRPAAAPGDYGIDFKCLESLCGKK